MDIVPALIFLLNFIPGVGPYMPLLVKALPLFGEFLPAAIEAIKSGAGKIEALNDAHPGLLPAIKQFAGMALNMEPRNISDKEAVVWATPLLGVPWTQEDEDRWLDKAKGSIG